MTIQNNKYVAYYRVSTQRQGLSGLGLEAQQAAVKATARGAIIAEYTDVVSGKQDNRPELMKALDHAKQQGATLIVAKLDRLSRNIGFIVALQEAKTPFVCCDMPEANELTIHIFAAIAQHERKVISQRTKDALKAAKDRGQRLGGPNIHTPEGAKAHSKLMHKSRKSIIIPKNVAFILNASQERGLTLQQTADQLNEQGLKTRRNNQFSAVQVFRMQRIIAKQ